MWFYDPISIDSGHYDEIKENMSKFDLKIAHGQF
jgi:hypothetical protein